MTEKTIKKDRIEEKGIKNRNETQHGEDELPKEKQLQKATDERVMITRSIFRKLKEVVDYNYLQFKEKIINHLRNKNVPIQILKDVE